MTKLLSIFLISGLLLLLPVGKVFADVSCQPVYGGGQTCITTGNIAVTKTVQNPQTGQFVNNLTVEGPTFAPDQIVTFNIALTNTGGATILQTKIVDTFPSFVTFSSGPGSFDQGSKTLTFTTDNLTSNETRNFTIKGVIADAKGLPNGITCIVNQATATTNNGQVGQNNSQFCIQKTAVTTKGGLPILPPPSMTATPSTGPELLPLIGLLPAGLSGWFMRKKSGGKYA